MKLTRPWWMLLGVNNFNNFAILDGKRLYSTDFREGVLIIHPCGTVQWKSNEWYEDEYLNEDHDLPQMA